MILLNRTVGFDFLYFGFDLEKKYNFRMLKTAIGGIDLDCCIYNASGPRTGHVSMLKAIKASRSGAVS